MFKGLVRSALVGGIAVLGPAAVHAQSIGQPTEASRQNPIVIDKAGPADKRSQATTRLLDKARAQGQVRVIAHLGISLQPAHALTDAQTAAQTQFLRAAQNAVVTRVLGKADAEGVVHFDYIPFVSMTVDAAQLSRLVADADVLHIEEDVAVPPSLTQSIPFINANDLWADGFPGTGITVAVLDTGVDKTHNMFPGNKIASEACYSTNLAAQGATSVCPGGVTSSTAAGSGVNCPLNVAGCNHGTHVAGIAAGNMASPALRGVARSSRIIAIQVFSRFSQQASCGPLPAPCALTFTSDQVKGLERVFALRNQFQIAAVNMSLGGGEFTAPCDADKPSHKAIIGQLRAARIATVIASGNSGLNGAIGAPACVSNAIAVGSTLDTANTLSDFSNHSPQVRLLAPGSNIQSSVPPGPTTTSVLNGTSMATPHVAGAFALLRDVKGASTVDDISAALECTGIPVNRIGLKEPRIDLAAARDYLLAPPNATRTFNFTNASELSQWTPYMGSWSLGGGLYRVATNTAGWKLSTTANCNESVTITSRIRRVWPGTQTSFAGIFFKGQLATIPQTPQLKLASGYFAAITQDTAGNNHDQNVVLFRLDSYDLPSDANHFGSAALLCKKNLTNGIISGTTYALKVVSAGGLHRVYLNNVLQCQSTDQSYGTGRAGLMTFVEAPTAGNVFTADNFILDPTETVPDAPAAAADGGQSLAASSAGNSSSAAMAAR